MHGKRSPTRTFGLAAALLVTALLPGCGKKTVVVEIPPRIDLQAYDTIGVVDFTSSQPDERLDAFATQRFMAVIQASQPGVRFLELGPASPLLAAVDRDRIDAETMRLVGQRHRVDTVFTGTYEIAHLTPQVALGQDLTSLSASARVKVTLAVRQWDTSRGATLWTNTHWGEWPVAGITKRAGLPVSVSVTDPRSRYGDFLDQLVRAVTTDFRVRYERRRVARN